MRKLIFLILAIIGIMVGVSSSANAGAAIVLATNNRPGFVTKVMVTAKDDTTVIAWGTGEWSGIPFTWVAGVNSDFLITIYVDRRLSPNEMDAIATASPDNGKPWEVYEYPSREKLPKPIAVAIRTDNNWANQEGTITTSKVIQDMFSRLKGVRYTIREIFKNLTR